MRQNDTPVKLMLAPAICDEAALVTQAQAGDRAAFGELVHLHRAGVINVVYRLCGDAQLAEDASQEAFIRAWQHLPGYQPRSPFRNWLYRIATNVALDNLRRERETVTLEAVQLRTTAAGPEAACERSEQAEQVRAAVLALPVASRTVLVLREYEGLSYREIAETLFVSVNTVKTHLTRIYGKLGVNNRTAAARRADELTLL